MQQIQPVLEVMILKSLKSLVRGDFIDLKGLILLDQVKAIPIPCSTISQFLNQDHVHVLNVFIYYILFVKYKIDIFDKDPQGHQFRTYCVKQISHYYIKNKLQIQLRDFSFLAGVILNLKTYQCAHIIFHLIYGRFASQPFIRSLCANFQKVNKINFKSCKKQINQRVNSQIITHNYTKQLQLNDFYQQLKNSIDPQARKTKPKRPLIGKRQNQKIKLQLPKYNDQYEQNYHHQSCRQKQQTYFVPVGIRKGQNSSIMESLPFHKTQSNFRNQTKKTQMRKQKFTLKSNIDYLKSTQKNRKSFDTKKQTKQQLTINDQNKSQIAKTGINNVKKIALKLKMQNDLFDEARKLCEFKNTLTEKLTKTINYETQKLSDQKIINLDYHPMKSIQMPSQKTLQNYIKFCHQELDLMKNQIKPQENNFFSINRVQQTYRSRQQNGKTQNIFTEQLTGWTNSNCKKRVQNFKNQYRKFLNTQLFEKIIRANQLQI